MLEIYLIEKIRIKATPIVSHYYSLFEGAEIDGIEGCLHPFDDVWKILAPLEFGLSFGGVGEVDEEVPGILEGVGCIEGFPDLIVVGPPLQENNDFLAVGVTFKVVLERFD